MTVRLYRATVLDTPRDPFVHGVDALRVDDDAGLVVADGRIMARGRYEQVRAEHPHAPVEDLRGGLLLPGLVDTHVHYPQVRAIGGLGMPLLQWLEECALPEEARLADHGYAAEVAAEFLSGLVRAGTTTALVFGSHFSGAVEVLLEQADRSGLRITAGQVLSDRRLRPELHTDPETAVREGRELLARWHGRGRLRYAITPRFSLSASDPLLEVCKALLGEADGMLLTSHLNENPDEIAAVAELFPGARDYLDTYDRHGLLGTHAVLAHDVHPTDRELARMAELGTAVAHCPTSNAALASGLFPLRRHVEHGVPVALGCDVGAGSGFGLLKEGLQAAFVQQLRPDGYRLQPAHLLYLATAAGARALGLADRVGVLDAGFELDAVWVRPESGSVLHTGLRHARDGVDALAKTFVLGTPADVAAVWVGGDRVR